MSINTTFLTECRTIPDMPAASDILSAVKQIQPLGRAIALIGPPRSAKTTFVSKQTLSDSRGITNAQHVLNYRMKQIGQNNIDVVYIATDDERIPPGAIVMSAKAAKPARFLLDDGNILFCRIMYDLVKFYSANTKSDIKNYQPETLAISIGKSLEYYNSHFPKNELSEWVIPEDEKLIGSLTQLTAKSIEDGCFLTSIKMMFKNSETERNNRFTNSSESFELFCKWCSENPRVSRQFDGWWKSLCETLTTQLDKFKAAAEKSGGFFNETSDTLEIVLPVVSDPKQSPDKPLKPEVGEFTALFKREIEITDCKRAYPESYFSSIRYIYRMNEEIRKMIDLKYGLHQLEIAEHDGKTIHALRFVEVGCDANSDPNKIDAAIKCHSCIGGILFGTSNDYSTMFKSCPEINKVLSDAGYRLPIVAVKSKMDSDALLLRMFANSSGTVSENARNDYVESFLSIEERAFQKEAKAVEASSISRFGVFREPLKNKNKLRPYICGAFSCGCASEETAGTFRRTGIYDVNSSEFISDVISTLLKNALGEDAPIIPIKRAALDKSCVKFTNSSITVTPNIFSTLSSCFCETQDKGKQGAGDIISSWLNSGEKPDPAMRGAPNASFINSIRTFPKTYLKKFLSISDELLSDICSDEYREPLKALLDDSIQNSFGTCLARGVGRYCYTAVSNNHSDINSISQSEFFGEMLITLSQRLFPDDKFEVSEDTELGKLITISFNNCVYDTIRRNCRLVF